MKTAFPLLHGKQSSTESPFKLLVWNVFLEVSSHGEIQKIKNLITKAHHKLQGPLKELDTADP